MSEIVRVNTLAEISSYLSHFRDQGVKKVTLEVPIGLEDEIHTIDLFGYEFSYKKTYTKYTKMSFKL